MNKFKPFLITLGIAFVAIALFNKVPALRRILGGA